jgi:hypothetical protein
MTKTPEGFLICHSVPICRTGTQKYLGREIGIPDKEILNVERRDSEVFKPSAIASFEGKPVCDDHPTQDVDAANWSAYTKGTAQNVRRGTGDDADKLVCDLVIYDAGLISKIEAGKRDISCGYDCKYIDDGDGQYHQADIIGNHIAVVDKGRAGHSVSIRDAMPIPKGGKKMAKQGILQRMFAAFSKDAEPDEIREAARALDKAEACDEDTVEEKAKVVETQDEDMELVMQAIKELNDKVDALTKADAKVHESMDEDVVEEEEEVDALDALEGELKEKVEETEDEDPEGEESVTIAPEKIEEKVSDEDVVEEEEEEKVKAADSALAVIRAMKPIIASMPPTQRKRAADAMSRELRKTLRTKASQPLMGGYGSLAKRRATNDASIEANLRAFGEACRKRNPHHKQ